MNPTTAIVLIAVISSSIVVTFSLHHPEDEPVGRKGLRKVEDTRKYGNLLDGSKVDIDEFLIGVIENFRVDMIQGLPELKVPVLDPFRPKKPFNVDVEDKKASVHGSFSNVNVEGMSGFVMEYLHANLLNLSLEFYLRLPWIKATGNYTLDGKIMKIMPLRGAGDFRVESFNLSLAAKASLETSEDNHLQLSKDFDVTIDFDKVELYLANFMGGGQWTEVILKIINDLSKDIFKKFLPTLKEELNHSMLKVINKHLMKLPITSIIPGSDPNEYVDQILNNVRQYIRDNNFDPLGLPDYNTTFSKEIVYVNFTGEATLYKGLLSGISTLHRTDECELITNRTTISVSAHLGLNDLKLSYKGHAKFMEMGPSLVVGGSVEKVEFYFKIHQTNKRGAKPVLEEFKIVELSTIWIELTGLGPLTWIMKWMLTGISKLVESFIVGKVTDNVRGYMANEFEKLSFPV